jgi:uncharacterized membrane protein (DUF106 family)
MTMSDILSVILIAVNLSLIVDTFIDSYHIKKLQKRLDYLENIAAKIKYPKGQ